MCNTNSGETLGETLGSLRRKAPLGSCLLGLIAGVAFMPTVAHAALDLTLSEPTFAPLTDSTGGSSLSTGLAAQTYGDFSYSNLVVNSSETTSYSQLTLDSATITNTDPNNAHTISILVADTDFTLPGGPGSTLSLTGAYSGTALASSLTTGTASMTSYADSANHQDPTNPANAATTTSISSTPQAFSFLSGIGGGTGTTVFQRSSVGTGAYSLAGVITITLSKGGTINLNDNTFTFANPVVPEPTSLAMLATSGMLFLRRRRSGK
jgi:hypothetical protein